MIIASPLRDLAAALYQLGSGIRAVLARQEREYVSVIVLIDEDDLEIGELATETWLTFLREHSGTELRTAFHTFDYCEGAEKDYEADGYEILR